MSVRPRKDSPFYWVHIQVGGESIRKSTKTKDYKKAKEFEARLRARLYEEREAGITGKIIARPFDEALERWLDTDAKTLKSYDNILDKTATVTPWLEGVNLSQVPNACSPMVSSWIKKGLKPATINRRLAIVRRVLKRAFEWGWLRENIASRIKLLPENNARHVYLNAEEIEVLADLAGRSKDLVLVLAYTGLRVGEMFSLTGDNIIDGCIVLTPNTKSGKPRIIPIPDRIKHVKFPITVTRNQFRTDFEAARGDLDLKAHDLRHSYASLLVSSGASMTAIRDLLGHSHLGVTSRYSHLSRLDLVDTVKKLNTTKTAR